jgi:hypothetical protein
MRAKPISRQQARKALEEIPINELLLVSNSELTAKQMEFAKQVALGNSGAESYRKAYSSKGKKKTQGDNASRMKADSRIQAAISAYEMANQAAAYRSASGLRELVIDSLVQVLIDPETKAAQRIQAAKTIGTITEVSLFTEQKRVTHVTESGEIKDQIMNQLKSFLLSNDNVTDIDADQLLSELTLDNMTTHDQPDSQHHDHERVSGEESAPHDPHPTPTPQNLNEPPPLVEHTIPHEPTQSETTPISVDTQTGVGDINIETSDVSTVDR